ncbi:MAG: hypothetical protein ACRDVG_07260, partial [Jatrophihabitantaceae bacterium]
MVLIGLLLAALACLVVGLVLASGIWLLASLVASAVAGYMLWRQREQIAARTGVHKNQAAPKTPPEQTALVTGSAFAAAQDGAPAEQRSYAAPDVWVVDGKPQFHRAGCSEIPAGGAQAIPFAEAVEDGFTACAACTPAASRGAIAQVWVVDGRPDYHLEDCRSLKIAATQGGTDGEAIPRAQAVEDGFSPCPDCGPDGAGHGTSAPAPAAPTSDAARAGVWVV